MGNFFSRRENNSTSLTSVRLSTAHLTVIAGFHCPPIESEIRNQLINKPRIWDMIDDYSGFPKETPELKFGFVFFFFFFFFFFRSATVCNEVLNTHARRFDSDVRMAWCNGGRRKVYAVEDQHKYCEKYAQNGYQIFTQRSR